MYSYEIQQLLQLKNYLLSNKEYIDMINTSPQINHVRYNPYENEFETWTDDNYYFKYKVYVKE